MIADIDVGIGHGVVGGASNGAVRRIGHISERNLAVMAGHADRRTGRGAGDVAQGEGVGGVSLGTVRGVAVDADFRGADTFAREVVASVDDAGEGRGGEEGECCGQYEKLFHLMFLL